MQHFSPQLLRQIRHQAGLTQEALAERAGIARTNYVNLETGARTPGPTTLTRLATALGLQPHQLSGITPYLATLRDLREWAGLSQTETAHAAGWASPTTYARIERGQAPLDAERIGALAAVLRVTAKELLAAAERAADR